MNFEQVKKEIANNLLNELNTLVESGDKTGLNEWFNSLTEEEISILDEGLLDWMKNTYQSVKDTILGTEQPLPDVTIDQSQKPDSGTPAASSPKAPDAATPASAPASTRTNTTPGGGSNANTGQGPQSGDIHSSKPAPSPVSNAQVAQGPRPMPSQRPQVAQGPRPTPSQRPQISRGPRPNMPSRQMPTFRTTGTSDIGTHMQRSLGGNFMEEQHKPTMADFRLLQERIMRKSNGEH